MSARAAVAFSTVTLGARMARPLWLGHPWVRSDAIARVDGPVHTGDVVRVVDEHGSPIDFALWSAQSHLRARVLGVGPEWPSEWPVDRLPEAFWETRIRAARALRAAVGLPGPDTDSYRLLNSEGDATPGVIVDVYGDVAVVHITTAAAYAHRAAIFAALEASGVVRHAVVQTDGRQAAAEGLEVASGVAFGAPPEALIATERGVLYHVTPLRLQKTGHYCDQRENRVMFGRLASGRVCLDAHAFTGGFALHAARGGARRVVAIDSSGPALEVARANAAANGVEARIELRRSPVEDGLHAALEAGERFDLISLDPPKLAASRRDLERALRKVEALSLDGLRVLAPGGLLVMASCSHAIGPDDLKSALAAAAGRAHAHIDVIGVTEQPPDHPYPAAMREGRYLSAVWIRRA